MATAEILDAVGDGALDAGLVRCPPARDGLEAHVVRHERQGVLLRGDHPLAGGASVALAQLDDVTLLLHPREANPGHYDAVLALCRAAGVEPRVLERSAELDLAQTPVVDGRAVAIVGESSRTVLPAALTWLALQPAGRARGGARRARARSLARRSERLLAAAPTRSRDLGWLDGHAAPALSTCRGGLSLGAGRCLASAHAYDHTIDSKQVIERYVAAWRRATRTRSATSSPPDATWWLGGDLPISGTWSGRETIMADFLATAMAYYEPGSVSLEVTRHGRRGRPGDARMDEPRAHHRRARRTRTSASASSPSATAGSPPCASTWTPSTHRRTAFAPRLSRNGEERARGPG